MAESSPPPRPTLPAMQMLSRGVDSFAGVMARTYGPVAGQILVSRGGGLPEVLDDSGVLARRITALDAPQEHAGVMAVREMCLAMRTRYGDGSATSAVLAKDLVRSAAKLTTGGANPMAVRDGIERGVAAACDALAAAAVPISGADDLSRLAAGATHDDEIAGVLGELYDIVGEHAGLIIEEITVPGIDRSYIDGARWRARPAYRGVIPEGSTELTMHDAVVVVVDGKLTQAPDVVPVLDAAATSRRPLLLVSRGIEGEARTCIQRNRHRVVVTPVCLASGATQIGNDLDDLALMCSATLLADERGNPASRFDVSQAGSAGQIVVHKDKLVVQGGAGERHAVSQRADEVKARMAGVERGSDTWRKARLRFSRLTGSMGVIVVGGYTDAERKQKIEQVRRAQRILELALESGTAGGGGVAYLECVDAVRAAQDGCAGQDESWGVAAVAAALTAPFRQIIANYAARHDGPHPEVAVDRAAELGAGWGFDASTGAYVHMAKEGVLDSVGVLQGALRAAGSLAGTVTTAAGVVRARSVRP